MFESYMHLIFAAAIGAAAYWIPVLSMVWRKPYKEPEAYRYLRSELHMIFGFFAIIAMGWWWYTSGEPGRYAASDKERVIQYRVAFFQIGNVAAYVVALRIPAKSWANGIGAFWKDR